VAINRICDFYTQMGPGDVIISGFFERNPDAPPSPTGEDGMRVTPATAAIEEDVDGSGNVVYRLTLPGAGEVSIAGICLAFTPTFVDLGSTEVQWAKWTYNNADRTVYIEIRDAGGPAASTIQLALGQRLYFVAHAYQSGTDPITQRVEVA